MTVSPIVARLPLVVRLALRDLRGGLRGMRVLAACLALGVFAIAAAGSTHQAVEEGLRQNGQRLLGGDLELRLSYRRLTPDQTAALAAHGTLSQGQRLRAMARTDDRGPSADQTPRQTLVEVKTVDAAYPLFGQVTLAEDSQVSTLHQALARQADGLWGGVVEAALLERLRVKVGDVITVGEQRLRLTAVITQEPDRVAGVATFGPRLMMRDAALQESGLLHPGSLVYQVTRLRLTDGAAPADVARSLQRRFPDAGWRVRLADEAAPGLQRFMAQVSLYLTLVGLTALLIGGLGVANAVRVYVQARMATIAILKSVGASARQIFLMYLLQIGLLSLCGVGVGVLLGALLPWGLAPLLAVLLPFAPVVGFYPFPLGEAALFGLLTALAFALFPLLRARTTPVASLLRTARGEDGVSNPAAIGGRGWMALGGCVVVLAGLVIMLGDDKFLAFGFVVGAVLLLLLFRLLAIGMMGISRRLAAWPALASGHPGLRLILSNLYRPGSQTPSLVISLGLGMTALVTVALIEANLTRQIGDRLPAQSPAFYFIDIQPDQRDAFAQAVAAVPQARLLDTADMVRGRIVALNGQPVDPQKVDPKFRWVVKGDRGLSTAAEQPTNARVVAGRWWPRDYAGPPLVSVAADMARGLGLDVGDTVTVNVLGRDITATVATLRHVEWSTLSMNFAFMASPGTLRGAPRTWIATVAAPPEAEEAVQRSVTAAGSNISAIGVRQVLESVTQVLQQTGLAIRATATVIVLAGALVLGGAMAAGHQRRLYESVILKVLGAQRRHVVGTHLGEYILLGLACGLVSIVLGGLASWAVLRFVMGVDWVFLPRGPLIILALCVGLVVAVGLTSTWRALSAKAAPLLRQE